MSDVTLEKMSDLEFSSWFIKSKDNYRDEIHKNGSTFNEAQKKADDDMSKLLPDGKESPDQYIFAVKAKGQWVGTLWFGVRGAEDNRKAFIYDIVLDPEMRGHGLGKKAMELLEEKVKSLGLKHIGLHVFGHNTIAINLYEKLGYKITNLNMEKVL